MDFPEKETNEQWLEKTSKYMQSEQFSLSPCLDYCGSLLACSRSDLPFSLGSLCSKQELEVSLKGRRWCHSSTPNLTLLLRVKAKALMMDGLKEHTPQVHQALTLLLPTTLFSRLSHSSLPSWLLKHHLLSKAILATLFEIPTPSHSIPYFIPTLTNSVPCFLFYP